ncbi:MAG: zinc transporter ZntB [Rhodospirillales bacterium]|nr:zinc transporter ZntB [Rhodospirillales bacterium]
MRDVDMNAGLEPGLRFACLLDGRGGCAEMDWKGVAAWRPEQGFLWIHLERDVPDAMRWITEASGVEPLVAQALLDDESRPTIESFDAALLLVLRGVNLAEKDEVELVPIHIWIDQHRAITLRDKDHALSALRDIRIALQCGRGPRKPGGLLVQICEKIVRDTGPSVEEMDDEVEHLEDLLAGTASKELRRDLAELRRRAVHLRRFLGPQREALIRLQTEDTLLLDKSDRMRLRCVIDSVIRYLEDMDALRDRTTILHEELAAQISEKIALTSNRLTAVAALLLPPSLVAGMLGANIGGIPGQQSPIAFWEMSLVMLALMLVQGVVLRRIGWL